MKAIKHKPTGQWLICDDSDEYILSDECYPFTSFGTDEQIAEEVEIISDGEYMADDIEVVTVHVLPDADLDTIRREAFEAGRDHVSIHGILRYDNYEQYKQSNQ